MMKERENDERERYIYNDERERIMKERENDERERE